MIGERLWGMTEIVKWLESDEGEDWSKFVHEPVSSILASIKDDEEDNWIIEYSVLLWVA
jgi:hypothetical protein